MIESRDRGHAMQNLLENIVKAGFVISRGFDVKRFVSALVDQLFDITGASIVGFYSQEEDRARLLYHRGRFDIRETFSPREEPFQFVIESGEMVVLTSRKQSPFLPLLLCPPMNSGIIAPVRSGQTIYAFIILNSKDHLFFDRNRLNLTEALTKLAGEYFHNTVLHRRLIDYTRRIQILERYQENIFTSMSNLLITTDIGGNLKYFNAAAGKKFSLSQGDMGRNILTLFKNNLGTNMLDLLKSSITEEREILGAEGIYRRDDGEMDFSLTLSPLRSRRNKREGLTLLFTDQSRERELEHQVKSIKEERRKIKDMFSRYVSQEIVRRITANPGLINLGGDKKNATVLFADIRGYTSFSEGRDPEYIVQVLNEYFSEAVEIVLRHSGYIDKFIGDCIMAAWGVPLQSELVDAQLAVSCALEIQHTVKSPERSFFRGEAKNLAIGIGIHTGPLVAGNLGSSQRVDYTMIGDTVNIAARLEGVAGPGEIIITENTKTHLSEDYRIKRKQPVRVKGKSEPLKIYSVLKKVN
jgi:PAS domain S-box-containing protein